VSLMSIAVLLAMCGVVRITGSWRPSASTPPPCAARDSLDC
jgi:hypothetical protein